LSAPKSGFSINNESPWIQYGLFPQILLSIFSSLGGAASLLLLLVPVCRVTVTYPERVILDVGCSVEQDRILHLGMSGDPPCTFVPSLSQGKIHQVKNERRELWLNKK
jgi:hypothetical protein